MKRRLGSIKIDTADEATASKDLLAVVSQALKEEEHQRRWFCLGNLLSFDF